MKTTQLRRRQAWPRRMVLVASGLALCLSCQPTTKRPATPPAAAPPAASPPVASHLAEPAAKPAAPDTSMTVAVVQGHLRALFAADIERHLIPAASRRFTLAEYDLNTDGRPELFVGLTGPYFCGSGGCTWLLLHHTGTRITRFTVSRYPVLVATARTNGWRDLLVSSSAGYHRLKFDGMKYPANPSRQPGLPGTPPSGLPRLLEEPADSVAWLTF